MICIAKDLVKLYPALGDPSEDEGGFEIWYYNVSGCPHASGYLQEKLQNQRRHFKSDKSTSAGKNMPDSTGWTSDENGTILPEFYYRFII